MLANRETFLHKNENDFDLSVVVAGVHSGSWERRPLWFENHKTGVHRCGQLLREDARMLQESGEPDHPCDWCDRTPATESDSPRTCCKNFSYAHTYLA